MVVLEQQSHYNSGTNDVLVSYLKAQMETTQSLIKDIETDTVSSEAVKIRVSEIESHFKQLRKVI